MIVVTSNFVFHNGHERNYQFYIGLEFYRARSDPNSDQFENVSTASALRFVGGGSNILVEDCRFVYSSISVESYQDMVYRDLVFRRNIVLDAWTRNSSTSDSHTSGLYFSRIDGYLVEENFFDHCGWNEQLEDANANMFAHNVYIQYDNTAGGVFRGNISARGASHGAQLRSGGVAERNLFVLNAIGATFGGVSPPTDPNVMTFDNVFRENVIINGRLMDPMDTSYPRTGALWGFTVAFIGEVDVIDNIIANRRDSGGNLALEVREPPAVFRLVDNIIYKWEPARDMLNPDWPHPDHNPGHYFKTLFGTEAEGEEATIEYLNWLRERPLRTLPWEMTAYAAINFIREGFSKVPVEGYFEYKTLAEIEHESWADWPKDSEGNVDTGAWLGWMNVSFGDWISYGNRNAGIICQRTSCQGMAPGPSYRDNIQLFSETYPHERGWASTLFRGNTDQSSDGPNLLCGRSLE